MNKPPYSALLALLILAPLSVHAGVTVNLDAGQLTSSLLTPMQADNNLGSPNGSLLLLIDLGAGNTASDILTTGQYVSGNNVILGAGGFNDNGGTNETNTVFNFNVTKAQIGDEIALRWFPQITLADYLYNHATPSALDVFGTYSPNGGSPDGGDNWLVADGATLGLNFLTSNIDGGGGMELPTAGVAATPVVGIVVAPEPSTYALFGLGALALFFVRRRLARVSVA